MVWITVWFWHENNGCPGDYCTRAYNWQVKYCNRKLRNFWELLVSNRNFAKNLKFIKNQRSKFSPKIPKQPHFYRGRFAKSTLNCDIIISRFENVDIYLPYFWHGRTCVISSRNTNFRLLSSACGNLLNPELLIDHSLIPVIDLISLL